MPKAVDKLSPAAFPETKKEILSSPSVVTGRGKILRCHLKILVVCQLERISHPGDICVNTYIDDTRNRERHL